MSAAPRRALLAALAGAAALVAPACSEPPNRLTGSLAEVYPLDFERVEASLIGEALVVEYLRATLARTLKLTLDRSDLAITPGEAIDLAVPTRTGTRGTLQRIVEGTTELPLKRGSLTLDQVPAAGARLAGRFTATFTEPDGRTLTGAFDAEVVQK